MSSLQGIPGLPFHWSAGGIHEYGYSQIMVHHTSGGVNRYVLQLTCPADRVVYVLSVYNGSSGNEFYCGKFTSDATLTSTTRADAVVGAAHNFGAFDTTATVKCGETSDSITDNRNIQIGAATSATDALPPSSMVFTVPIILVEGEYFTCEPTSTALLNYHAGFFWLEKKIP